MRITVSDLTALSGKALSELDSYQCCTATKMPIYIFLFWELRGLSPNFHIHISVSDLYIPRISPHISWRRIGRSIVGIYKSLTDTWMWKLALWSRNSFLGLFIIFLGIFVANFTLLVLSSVVDTCQSVRTQMWLGHLVLVSTSVRVCQCVAGSRPQSADPATGLVLGCVPIGPQVTPALELELLKVDSNEKRELLNFCLGLWRSRVIFNLNMLIPCKTPYFCFRLLQLN